MNIDALLSQVGLDATEMLIYSHLVKLGEAVASVVMKDLKIEKTKFYRTLDSMNRKGLITIHGVARKQTLRITGTETLQRILQQKQVEIDAAKESLHSLATTMQSLQQSHFLNDNIEIFTGDDAYFQVMKSVLQGGGKVFRDLTPDSEAMYHLAGSPEKYAVIANFAIKTRLEKGIEIRLLFDTSAHFFDEKAISNPKTFKLARQYPADLQLECFINTCGTYTTFYSPGNQAPFGLLIKDQLITNVINTLFDVLWGQAKEL